MLRQMKYYTSATLRRCFALLLIGAACALSVPTTARAQQVALKTNLLYWATTTPNIGAEVGIGQKHSAQIYFGLNPWKQSGGDQSSLRHWSIMPEWRHWFCQKFNGWFVGIHGMGGEFNAGGVDLPFGIFKRLEDHRYEGWYVGGGITGGYQWPISRHWSAEAALGIGYDYIHYKEAACGTCGEIKKRSHSHYFGPTKAALSIIYVF